MQTLGKLPRIAAIVAFVDAGLIILLGLIGPIVLLPAAIIPMCAGIGILRRRVWSAYGFTTILLVQLPCLPVILFRSGNPMEWHAGQAVFTILFALALAILFLLAGRSLAASGATRGRALPWIVTAILVAVPCFFIRTFRVASTSMEGTLLSGDFIFATTFPHEAPRRGTIAVFRSPQDRSVNLVKRVVAVPGDHLRISGTVVTLNGAPLDESYVVNKGGPSDFYSTNFRVKQSLPVAKKVTQCSLGIL